MMSLVNIRSFGGGKLIDIYSYIGLFDFRFLSFCKCSFKYNIFLDLFVGFFIVNFGFIYRKG